MQQLTFFINKMPTPQLLLNYLLGEYSIQNYIPSLPFPTVTMHIHDSTRDVNQHVVKCDGKRIVKVVRKVHQFSREF